MFCCKHRICKAYPQSGFFYVQLDCMIEKTSFCKHLIHKAYPQHHIHKAYPQSGFFYVQLVGQM